MGRNFSYFQMQLKRMCKVLPVLLAVNLLACACMGILAARFLEDGVLSENGKKFQIGVVGEFGDSYLGLQFYTLIQSLDDSRFMLELRDMTEKEAAKGLRRGEISAYLRLPDGLLGALDSGANDVYITYVAGGGQKGIAGTLAMELVDVASTLVTRSQSAVFGMQRVLQMQDRGSEWEDATQKLCFRLVEFVLNRTKLCEVEVLGMANGLSTQGYYFCSILIIFLLLAGINNSSFFINRSRELHKIMSAKGVGAFFQVLGEYLSYLCLTVIYMAGIFLLLMIVLERGFPELPEWKDMKAETLPEFFVRFLPVAAMIAAMQFLLYEMMSGIVSSILTQFVCCISMAYVSGCFYPAAFFPDMVQRIGELLPTGAALHYVNECFLGNLSLTGSLGICFYLLLFLGLSMGVRKYRIQNG
ncbi:MAG: ABC transporter permease [Bacteroidales bacterium]|nr:ABC transporter permease [Lachnoclostridium sp.]MCM1382920.1 ABC transporter permease [Lachnoclostridium sp.]MCM1465926.1 ABC transporter permease [Bacteroidales bacterium]